MSLTSFVVCRNWASNRLRTLLSVLGVAFGVAIVVAIYVMDHNTIRSRQLAQDPQRGPVELEVVPLAPEYDAEQVRAALKSHAGVEDVALWQPARGTIATGDKYLDVEVYGLEPLPGGVFAHYAVAQGRDLAAADGDRAVLVGAEAARMLALEPGVEVTLVEPGLGQIVECRDGELRVLPPPPDHVPFRLPVTVAGILAADRVGRRNFGQVLVCSYALARRLPNMGPGLFQVQRTWLADLDRLRDELRPDYRVQDLRAAMIGEGADERAFRNGIKVLGCLALVLGMFVVFQTLSHSLVTRVRMLGLLRCLGVGRWAVARIFLGDAVAMGTVGSVLGVGGGLGIAAVLRWYDVSSLGLGKAWHTFEVPLVPVAWTAVLGLLFTLAGALLPLLRARNLTPLQVLHSRGLGDRDGDGQDLLRGVHLWLFVLLVLVLPVAYLAMTPLVAEEGYETLVVLAEMGGMVLAFGGLLLLAPITVAWLGQLLLWPLRRLFPLAVFLLRTVLQRGAGRLAAAVCGLAAVLLALLGLKSLTASLRAEVRAFAAEALEGRVFLEGPAVTPAVAMALAALPGVAAVEPQAGLAPVGFLLGGLALESAAAAGGALEQHRDAAGRYASRERRTLVASQRLAAKMGWRPGSLVPLADRNGMPVSYEVLLVSDRSGYQPSERAWAITSPYWLQHDFCIPPACVGRITLRLQPGADPGVVLARADQALPGRTGKRRGDYIREFHLFDVTRDFMLFDLLLLLILLLAGIGLVNGMTIAALGRIREFGVLRALGVGAATLRGIFLLEGALVALLAAGMALLLCLPMAKLLIAGLNKVAGLHAPVELPVKWMWATPGIALLVGLLAAVLPGLRAVAQSPATSVRCE